MFVEVERCRKGGVVLEASAGSEEKAGRWLPMPLQWGGRESEESLETENPGV
jgi:hypothetical protein